MRLHFCTTVNLSPYKAPSFSNIDFLTDALDEVSQEEVQRHDIRVPSTVADEIQSDEENDKMLSFFRRGFETGSLESKQSGKGEILSKIFQEMVTIDRERALTAIKSWAAFLELASGRQHAKKFETLEDYYSYRILDVGEMYDNTPPRELSSAYSLIR